MGSMFIAWSPSFFNKILIQNIGSLKSNNKKGGWIIRTK
ncbi:hypothetical protein N495_12195 [Clostridium botulinum B2 450]|uniref:Uncharacterized protein n=1 Tax=Clostridium botulinum B2 450 TaxID=1379739 RepID=A0A0D1AMD1_CLOBO|nr:hypothetical protein N495_12195 [Clostridium botulinum B2 450]